MAVKIMTRTAKDNKYLHRDFHISCDVGINYIGERYGTEGVKAYLRQYVDAYLSPLAEKIRMEGLDPLKRYFLEIYRTEEAEDQLQLSLEGDTLKVSITACPALTHMRKSGHTPSVWYRETTSTLYGRLAQNAGLAFTLEHYDEQSGAASFRFQKEAKS